MTKRVIVVGGGAAGLFAAMKAKEAGADVSVLEKNNKLGKKMLITGKGRCNLTNSAPLEEIIENIPGNGTFLYSALYTCSNMDVVEMFREMGLPTKVERGGRVFPVSDQAADVVEALENYLRQLGVSFYLNTSVQALIIENNGVSGVRSGEREFPADAVIIAAGGASYPGTGSTGDGYRLAKRAGHTIIPLKPSLVPLETEETWVKEMQGLSLRNVRVTAWAGETKLGEEFGEMLFTHFGVSGPVILTLSKPVTQYLEENSRTKPILSINLKPALTGEQLDQRLQRDMLKFARRQLINSFGELLPKSMIPVFVRLLGIPEEKPVHQVTKEERKKIIDLLQRFPVTVSRSRPLSEAIVTAGGVSTREVNPRTMESKLVTGLFFAGEVLDIDGFTGGYNLQAAFSTGFVAGVHAAE